MAGRFIIPQGIVVAERPRIQPVAAPAPPDVRRA
jgi:hypothetical protein